MRDKILKNLGVQVTKRVRTTIEVEMSDDHADCIAAQIENLLHPDPEKVDWDNQDAQNFVNLINEILR